MYKRQGYDCSDVGADFLAAGVDVFIMKPLFKSNMVHLLRNFAEDRGCGHASAVPRPEGQRLDGLHVLLVEDNEINQEIAKELLLMEGASVDVYKRQVFTEMLCRLAATPKNTSMAKRCHVSLMKPRAMRVPE